MIWHSDWICASDTLLGRKIIFEWMWCIRNPIEVFHSDFVYSYCWIYIYMDAPLACITMYQVLGSKNSFWPLGLALWVIVTQLCVLRIKPLSSGRASTLNQLIISPALKIVLLMRCHRVVHFCIVLCSC